MQPSCSVAGLLRTILACVVPLAVSAWIAAIHLSISASARSSSGLALE